MKQTRKRGFHPKAFAFDHGRRLGFGWGGPKIISLNIFEPNSQMTFFRKNFYFSAKVSDDFFLVISSFRPYSPFIARAKMCCVCVIFIFGEVTADRVDHFSVSTVLSVICMV